MRNEDHSAAIESLELRQRGQQDGGIGHCRAFVEIQRPRGKRAAHAINAPAGRVGRDIAGRRGITGARAENDGYTRRRQIPVENRSNSDE